MTKIVFSLTKTSSGDKELFLWEVPREILLCFLARVGNLLPTWTWVSSFLYSSPSRLFNPYEYYTTPCFSMHIFSHCFPLDVVGASKALLAVLSFSFNSSNIRTEHEAFPQMPLRKWFDRIRQNPYLLGWLKSIMC